MKDIEGLAKVGEEYLLEKLRLLVKINMTCSLRDRNGKGGSPYWKNNFRGGVQGYHEIKAQAVNLGLDVSVYDKEVLRLTTLYSQLTGENDFAITMNKLIEKEWMEDGADEKSMEYIRAQIAAGMRT